MGVDGAVGDGAGVLPGVFEQLVAGEDAAGFLQQDEQQLVFVRGEIELLAVAVDAHGGVCRDAEPCRFAGAGSVGGGRLRAAQDGADTGDDFPRGKRLGHVVVAAEFETEDAVHLAVAGS